MALMVVGIGIHTAVVFAQSKTDEPKTRAKDPIEIFGDKTIADLTANTVELIGNVRAHQGNTAIKADRMKIFYKKGADGANPSGEEALEKIVASGNVEIKFDNRLAVTQEALYKVDERVFVMTGPGSKITSGRNWVTGDKIIFDRKNDRVTVEGGVKALIFPGEKGIE
jgi:lipopolysaccharide export system protein LptA